MTAQELIERLQGLAHYKREWPVAFVMVEDNGNLVREVESVSTGMDEGLEDEHFVLLYDFPRS